MKERKDFEAPAGEKTDVSEPITRPPPLIEQSGEAGISYRNLQELRRKQEEASARRAGKVMLEESKEE